MPTDSESKNIYRQHLPNGTSFDLIYVKGGSYFFGDSDYEINLPDFYIGQYPVTQSLWLAVMGNNPAHFKGKNRPMENVNWYHAAAFCNALNVLTGYQSVYFRDEKFQEQLDYGRGLPMKFKEDINIFHNSINSGYRLPSEAQWEYAARGGVQHSLHKYAGSDKLEEVGWYCNNSHRETKPIGLKKPNGLGIHDMSGNVWEWCADQWHSDNELKNIPKDGTAWVDSEKGASRVYRGGSWFRYAQFCRATYRYGNIPLYLSNIIGFRVVLFPPPASNN